MPCCLPLIHYFLPPPRLPPLRLLVFWLLEWMNSRRPSRTGSLIGWLNNAEISRQGSCWLLTTCIEMCALLSSELCLRKTRSTMWLMKNGKMAVGGGSRMPAGGRLMSSFDAQPPRSSLFHLPSRRRLPLQQWPEEQAQTKTNSKTAHLHKHKYKRRATVFPLKKKPSMIFNFSI